MDPTPPLRALRVAFMCFMPDWGHVIPLLKIAHAARADGIEVRCYVPESARAFVERSELSSMVLGRDNLKTMPAFKETPNQSLFFMNYNGYGQSNLFVYPRIMEAICGLVEDIRLDLREFDPNLVMGDAHIFADQYRAFAANIGAPVVIHNASGTLAQLARPYIRVYGLPDRSELWMRAVELAGRLFQRVYRAGFYLANAPRWLETRRIKAIFRRKIAESLPAAGHSARVGAATSGLSWIELSCLGVGRDSSVMAASRPLPPLRSAPEALARDLKDWLSQSSRPLVYVSFGSILRLPQSAYRALVLTFKEAKCRVLWSAPVGGAASLRELVGDDPEFHVTSYVAQAELLSLGKVACFVTHAGSASVLEALVSGTPLLCVPLHADNGYISGLVVRLGVGLRVWRRELTSSRLGDQLRRVLEEPAFAEQAKAVAAAIQEAEPAAEAAAFIRNAAAES